MGNNKIIIRRFQQGDLELVTGLTRANLKRYFVDTVEGWSEEKLFRLDTSRIHIVEDDLVPAGFLDYEPRETFGGAIYVHNIQLKEEYQRKGIGTHCLAHVAEAARREYMRLIYGKIFKDNQVSLNFAMNNGFEIACELPEELSYIVVKKV
jgi:GNAT superfamily N-acetyltransferase